MNRNQIFIMEENRLLYSIPTLSNGPKDNLFSIDTKSSDLLPWLLIFLKLIFKVYSFLWYKQPEIWKSTFRRIGHSRGYIISQAHNLAHSLDPHSRRPRGSPTLGSILLAGYKRQRPQYIRIGAGRFVRARRIELPSTGWKPVILPLNYARNILLFVSKEDLVSGFILEASFSEVSHTSSIPLNYARFKIVILLLRQAVYRI